MREEECFQTLTARKASKSILGGANYPAACSVKEKQ